MSADLLVARLRAGGGDATEIEAKSAAGGLPESLAATLSALANLPGGGTVILGVDERAGFVASGIDDPQALKHGLAAKARSLVPPVVLDIEDSSVDGTPVVVVGVQECDLSAKPCPTGARGAAYIRGWDGDYRMSDVVTFGRGTRRAFPGRFP